MSNYKLTFVLTLALAFVASACNGGNPVAPAVSTVVASPTPTATPKPGAPKTEEVTANPGNVKFINDDSGLAVVNVMVNNTMGTNAEGEVPAPLPMSKVSTAAAGYLPRQTIFNPVTPVIGLWPTDDDSFVRQLVYFGVEGFYGPDLNRFIGQVFVRLSPELMADPDVVASFEAAIAELNEKSGGFIPFALNNDPNIKDNLVTVSVGDTGGLIGGVTRRTVDSSGQTTGASIVFSSVGAGDTSRIAAHELGHAFGLHHTADTNDMMAKVGGARRFNEREALAMRMMARRSPGNRSPDTDPGISATSRPGKARVVTESCNF